MKDWIKLFCNSFSDTVYFGVAVVAAAVTVGAIWQILWHSLQKFLRF